MLREKRLTRKALAFLLVILLFWSCFSVAASATSPALPPYLDYEEYLDLVQSGDLPQGFLPYEHWESYGEFYTYVWNTYYPDWIDGIDKYELKASDDFYLSILRDIDRTYISGEAITGPAPEDWLVWRTSPLEEEVAYQYYYCRSGIYYTYRWRRSEDNTYRYSNLDSIGWADGENYFELWLPEYEEGTTLESYLEGVDENHPLRTLLSPDATDHDVMVALGILEPDPPLFETWEIVTLAVGGVVIAAGLVTLVVLLVPKKKKPVEE